MIVRLAICACLALAAASGDVLQYQVDFSSDTLTSCFIVCPPSPLPLGSSDAWIGTFDLNSSDLGTDGSYDVTSSFLSTKTFTDPTTLTGLTVSGTIDAVVSGGVVTGLQASNYQVSYEIVPNNGNTLYFATLNTPSADFFRLVVQETVIHTGTEAEDGEFSIGAPAAVPEPASLGSALALTALIGALGRWRRRSQTR